MLDFKFKRQKQIYIIFLKIEKNNLIKDPFCEWVHQRHLVMFFLLKPMHPDSNPIFDMSVIFMTNYYFSCM
jgi:hypothetical protein